MCGARAGGREACSSDGGVGDAHAFVLLGLQCQPAAGLGRPDRDGSGLICLPAACRVVVVAACQGLLVHARGGQRRLYVCTPGGALGSHTVDAMVAVPAPAGGSLDLHARLQDGGGLVYTHIFRMAVRYMLSFPVEILAIPPTSETGFAVLPSLKMAS